jgi:uncharacterized protein (TIGR01777 family)
MKVVLAGASGFLGSRLHLRLAAAGHELIQLVRRAPDGPAQRMWRPDRGEVDGADLAGVDVVINLAGAGVNDQRWNDAFRKALRDSRVQPTATLARAIADLPDGQRPALLNSSAVGFYGDTGETAVDEDSPAGAGYFPDLCQAWEAATAPASQAGVRVAHLRTGLPLDASGGLLKPLLIPFRLGVGGRLGNGRQWMPCLSIRDWLAAIEFLLAHPEITGPVNLVGPEPVRNTDFSRALGRALHRPALAPVPPFALRIVLGAFADEALASQRILPSVLTRHGFQFQDSTVDEALRAALA